MSFAVVFAGALGAISRYLLSTLLISKLKKLSYYSTTIVNIIGSLLLGICYGLSINNPSLTEIYTIVSVGFCGAFTTFSTFSYEAYTLFLKSRKKGIVFILISICAACLCATLGIYIVI